MKPEPIVRAQIDRREAYARIFADECAQSYPAVAAFEQARGYAVERARLEDAARVLACPLKANPPNWQHGRVLYAAYRAYLAGLQRRVLLLDIGTAKGFSALCAQWALTDAGVQGTVVSVDVIDPRSTESRNTVAELDGSKTLGDVLAPWPESGSIKFFKSTGIDWLTTYEGRIECAFVDGKHRADVVAQEARLLADRQTCGDLVIFDDVHIQPIKTVVARLREYDIEWLPILPNRAYAIGRRV